MSAFLPQWEKCCKKFNSDSTVLCWSTLIAPWFCATTGIWSFEIEAIFLLHCVYSKDWYYIRKSNSDWWMGFVAITSTTFYIPSHIHVKYTIKIKIKSNLKSLIDENFLFLYLTFNTNYYDIKSIRPFFFIIISPFDLFDELWNDDL